MHAALTLTLLLLHVSFSSGCHSFSDVNMTVVPQTGERYHTVLNTCLERKAFDATITEVYVEKQRIPKLATDSVRFMQQLRVLSFSKCQIEVVEIDLFNKVPRLREVKMTRNKIGEVQKGVFSTLEQLKILDLSNNRITRIEREAFGNSSTLERVYLGHNNLEVYSVEWFGNTTSVKIIDLQYNRIKEVPGRAFHLLPHLNNICFDYNEIDVIHPEAFAGLTYLHFLGLRHNKLKTIHPRSFPNLVSMDKLMIDANLLNYLPTVVLGKLEVKEVCLIGNPWKCSCLNQIHTWLHGTNGTIITPDFCKNRTIPVCSYPSTFTHTCLETVDDEVTTNYLGQLKSLDPPLDKKCARID